MYSIIDDLEKGKNKRFLLDDKLTDPKTGLARLAQNSQNGTFILNPIEWSLLSTKYSYDEAFAMKAATAVHEVLQQAPLLKEGTGQFAFSSQILKFKPFHTKPVDLTSYEGLRIKIRKGLAHQAICNTRTGFGDIQIREIKSSSKDTGYFHWFKTKNTAYFTWFETKNPQLCQYSDKRITPLTELTFNSVLGGPSQQTMTAFVFACSSDQEQSCGLIDFQSLPGESFDLNPKIDEVVEMDYRSEPADFRSMKITGSKERFTE